MTPGMETIGLVFTAKLIIVGAILGGASIMDIKYRRIPDRFWILMVLSAGPLMVIEMALKGGSDSPVTFLAILLPISGILFIMYGYPELKQAIKGNFQDILFFLIYGLSLIGGVLAFALGDRELFAPIGVSFIFMIIYFILYSVPIGGTRLIHGGADAKCLISLAALFPWYITDLPYQTGQFYDVLLDIPAIGSIFPFHLSIFFNGAVITGVVLLIYLPLKNLLKGEFSLRSFTTFWMDVDDLEGKHIWVVLEKDGKKKKEDPTPNIIDELRKNGENRVIVTPKIPFILSLTAGFLVQSIIGNIVAALFLIFS